MLWLWLAACGPESTRPGIVDAGRDAAIVDAGDDAGAQDAGPPPDLVFAGIETARWDGSDGLVGTWSAASLPVTYVLVVEAIDDGAIRTRESAALDATVTGLYGEYRLRVEAHDAYGRVEDGGRSLVQWVGDNRLVHRSEVPMAFGASVWGEGDRVVMAGWMSGHSFRVVDTTDVLAPETLTTVDGEGFVKEVKIADGLLFTNGECPCDFGTAEWAAFGGPGVRIFDFADPANPIRIGTVGAPTSSVHNLWVDDGYLYLTDNVTFGVAIWDVRDPAIPSFVTYWHPPSGLVHDQIVIGDLLYVAYWDGFAIVDVTDPANPVDVVVHSYGPGPGIACHNVWPTEDGRHVFTTDEAEGGGHLRVWDVSDPAAVFQAAEWWTDPTHVIHNVHVRGDHAFVSYYWDGVIVLDVSDPTAPFEVGRYDTVDEVAAGITDPWSGTWGVWPYGPHVAIGDMFRGLVLFDHFPEVVAWSE